MGIRVVAVDDLLWALHLIANDADKAIRNVKAGETDRALNRVALIRGQALEAIEHAERGHED